MLTRGGSMQDRVIGMLGQLKCMAAMTWLSARAATTLAPQRLWRRLLCQAIRGGRFAGIMAVFTNAIFEFFDTRRERSDLLLLRPNGGLHGYKQGVDRIRTLIIENLQLFACEHDLRYEPC